MQQLLKSLALFFFFTLFHTLKFFSKQLGCNLNQIFTLASKNHCNKINLYIAKCMALYFQINP